MGTRAWAKTHPHLTAPLDLPCAAQVIVRGLPPTMTEVVFREFLESSFPREKLGPWSSFVRGKAR